MARGPALDPSQPGTITARLGPTNTGKTHVAIQRMLAHRSGMIGLPLRLLAREVYDRVVREVGEDKAALVTGEEKRVGSSARYWICTVESMPVDRAVAFLAVDEVQLAGDRWRGHVFTDRILHARGVAETWFLGSDTIGPLLQELVPTVQIERQPRLSRLSWAGSRKLTALPRRSAVVAFSVRRVYELAERLRGRHGGTAVVMGALSPRARNAQVELYASGEVQHMVATDAIGMGLNLDVHHVALAGRAKFDGRSYRELRNDEIAQIAGRAGRYRRDGTFGVTAGLDPLEPEVIEALEGHRFPPLRRLYWRNSSLEFDRPERLLEGLRAAAPRPFLRAVHDADDARALERMLEEDAVRSRARSEAAVRVLWDVARIPDFGNKLPEHHADLLVQLYTRLIDHDGVVPEDWLAGQVRRLDRVEGDVDTLMGRIADIRIWTYLVNRPGWVADAEGWRARTQRIEERLSDALHDRLTERFVDRRATALVRGLTEGSDTEVLLRPGGKVEAMGQPLGTLRGLRFELERGARATPALERMARQLVRPLVQARVDALVDSPDGAFGVDPRGGVRWDGGRVAQLLATHDWRAPKLKMLRLDDLSGPQRTRVTERVQRWRRDWTRSLVAPLEEAEVQTPAERAILHALTSGLGLARTEDVLLLDALDDAGRARLRAAGIRIGRRWLWHRRLVGQVRARAVLASVHLGREVEVPEGEGRQPFADGMRSQEARLLGFERAADLWWRVDILEAVMAGAERSVGIETELARAVRDARKPKRRRRRRRR